jgi:hypothetical protein
MSLYTLPYFYSHTYYFIFNCHTSSPFRYKKKLINEACPSSIPIVAREKEHIISLLRNLFNKTFNTQETIVFNIGIDDGVKVPRILQFSTKHQGLIGGCHPHNFITRSEIEDESGTPVEDVQMT